MLTAAEQALAGRNDAQQGKSTAGSHRTGGIIGGRIYLPAGSCAPIALFTGGPPGIPGNPRPAVPNDLPRLELGIEPLPTVGEIVDPDESELPVLDKSSAPD